MSRPSANCNGKISETVYARRTFCLRGLPPIGCAYWTDLPSGFTDWYSAQQSGKRAGRMGPVWKALHTTRPSSLAGLLWSPQRAGPDLDRYVRAAVMEKEPDVSHRHSVRRSGSAHGQSQIDKLRDLVGRGLQRRGSHSCRPQRVAPQCPGGLPVQTSSSSGEK
ncbi:hypothetical protein VTK73DRAFT_4711 [Phialemonium thermophilum]|uniref:Uncharacterized protein n=1 Tax=Phialemonium thermophilum TaxID=223376 RepID=A0ABR3WRZ2_9PEZI